MTKYLISDTHLFHAKLLEFQRFDFKDVNEMNDYIIETWKEKIKPEDTVYHLGDFAFGDDFDAIEKIVQTLPGKVTLIVGNHDTNQKLKIYSKYWKIASVMFIDGCILSHAPVHPILLTEDTIRDGALTRFCIHGHQHKRMDLGKHFFNVNWDVLGEDKMPQLATVKDILKGQQHD